MATCEKCGNDYDKTMTISIDGESHTYDSFECAIAELAPTCAECGVHVIGHGHEANGSFYCCANCARADGVKNVSDRG